MTSTDPFFELAQRIAALEDKVAAGAPGLTHSTIEGGALKLRSDGGGLVGWVGKQWDDTYGAYVVGGPQPPTPSAPVVTSKNGRMQVEWLGTWDPATVNGSPVVAPMDLGRVEVHIGTAAQLPADVTRDTLKSFITSPRGGITSFDLDFATDYYAWLVVRSLAGVASAPSATVGPIQVDKLTAEDLAIDFDAIGGNKIHFGAATPSGTHKAGDIWNKWTNSPTLPAEYEAYRWDGDSWERLRDQEAVAAALAAEAASAAAALRARLYSQPTAPTGLTATDKGIWIDTDADNTSYIWDGDSWEPRRIGTAALEPASIVASTVLATGTITAPLLEAILVLASTIIAGDEAGEHTRIEATGVSNYAIVDGLPVELGRQGRGWSVRDPATGEVAASTTDTGIGSFRGLSVLETNDFLLGGLTIYDYLATLPKGIVAYGKYPITGGNSTLTNTEIAFLELSFIAEEGRSYAIYMEGFQPVNATDPGAWIWRLRYTTDGSIPTTASTRHKEYNTDGSVDTGWNQIQSNYCIYHGPTVGSGAKEVRLLFSYAAGTGSAASQGAAIYRSPHNIYAWVEDLGPTIPETGNEVASSSGGTTTLTNRVYEAAAAWQRTWNQSGSIIADAEMQQGYGDSFNGIRRSAAGWSFGSTFTGATITEVAINLESYHWWNMGGGTAVIGYHGNTSEPASFPAHTSPVNMSFTARSQNKWIVVPWGAALLNGTFKGISLLAPSTAAMYYGKFRGEGYGSGRPRLRVKYTK